MKEDGTPTPPPERLIPTPVGGYAARVSRVARYLEANRDRYTEEVLVQAARDRGYPDDVLEEARIRARAYEASAPMQRRARRWIQAAYLLTFAVLTIGMLANESQRYAGSLFWTGIPALALTLGLALLVSFAWLRRRGGRAGDAATGIVVYLSVPIVLLVTVAGLCVATGLPIPRPA